MHSRKSRHRHNHKIDSQKHLSLTFDAIGTQWTLDIPSKYHSVVKNITEEILLRIEEFDKTYSRFREDSLVYTMFENPGIYQMPTDLPKMLSLYHKLYTLSSGSFTPLVGTLLMQAGYDKDYSLVKGKLTKVPLWNDALSYTSDSLTIKKPVLLDFGACGKGYLIDLINEILDKADITNYCIDASGDILLHAEEPLRVGLEHPDNPNQVIGITQITNESICASAGNRRKWDEFHHIINPQNLASPKEILATWVKAENAITADALATCLFLTSPEILKEEFEFEYLILYENYTVTKSLGFNAELFYN